MLYQLENWGVETLLRSLRQLGEGDDRAWIKSVVSGGAQLRAYLKQQGQELLSFHHAWWDTVSGLLAGSPNHHVLSPLPSPATAAPLLLESQEDGITFRLNASNEIAIGLLAQHGDWPQGRLDELEHLRRVHQPALSGPTSVNSFSADRNAARSPRRFPTRK